MIVIRYQCEDGCARGAAASIGVRPGCFARKESIVATTKPKAAVVGEALEPILSVLDDTFARATNDEVIEVVLRAHEELARRAKNVSKLARDAGDRDVVNEAFAYCSTAYDLVPHTFYSHGIRQNSTWHDVMDAKNRITKAVQSRGSSSLTTRDPKPEKVEAFLDVAAFTDDEIVDAVSRVIAAVRYGRGTGPASSNDVVRAIAPNHKLVSGKNSVGGNMACTSALRMAQRLAKLAKAGRIVRYEMKWGGSKAWAVPGFTPTDPYILKRYVVAS
jgi:hypothetical protein